MCVQLFILEIQLIIYVRLAMFAQMDTIGSVIHAKLLVLVDTMEMIQLITVKHVLLNVPNVVVTQNIAQPVPNISTYK